MTASAPQTAPRIKPSGLVLGGVHSGAGKTAVACLMLAALRRRGVTLQPFKAGPDYIDASYHERFAGRPSRMLDTWMLGADGVVREVRHHGAGSVGVVEGVMGLFDGGTPHSDEGSTAELARILGWPVILVLPCATAGRSVIATVRGFMSEAGEGRIAGLILNQVGGESHARYLRESLAPVEIPVLGAIPSDERLKWPERHLGLQAAQEREFPSFEDWGELAESWLDVSELLELVEPSPASVGARPAVRGRTRIALARDEAFHFYYPSDLDYLTDAGFDAVPFSPLADRRLPAGVEGVVLGGGFPEVYAAPLAGNEAMRRELRAAIGAGMPCYAECGGLMYLAEALVDGAGCGHPMVGVVPGVVTMTRFLQHFGYCEARGSEGASLRGHEFHHSRWEAESEAANLWTVTRRSTGAGRREGYVRRGLHASYVHLAWSRAGGLIERVLRGG